MKRISAILLSVVLIFTLVACGGGTNNSGTSKNEDDIESQIRSKIQARAAVECQSNYSNVRLVLTTCTSIREIGDGNYDVKGYATITDDYGDQYKGRFNADVSVSEYGLINIKSFNFLETPKKQ